MVETTGISKEVKERLAVGKVLIIGASGMVGSRFLELYEGDFVTPTQGELDITNREVVKEFIERERPDVVINFAAYTNVNDAEKQRGKEDEACSKINFEGVGNLLDSIDPEKTHFIQVSTDMVFSGLEDDPGPYAESHVPETNSSRLTWYGYTKAEAERKILNKLRDKSTIVRIIYPVRAKFDRKPDYLRKPLQSYDTGKPIQAFTDQQVSITLVDDACEGLKKIVEGKHYGIFNFSSDISTPYEIYSYLLEKVRGAKDVVQKSSLRDAIAQGKINPVRYPLMGGLKTEETDRKLGTKSRKWKKVVDKLLEQGLGGTT